MARSVEKFRAVERALWESVGVAPDESWVSLPGGERVRVQTVGDGPPVLFVHGGSSSGCNWAPLVARMQHFRCLIIDRPGCGLSDPVAGGSRVTDLADVEEFADRLCADILDGLGIDRAHVVSTSMGGYFALRGAAAHPGRVDRIVEIAWSMGAPMGSAPMSMRFAAIPGLGMLMTKVPPTRFAVKKILKQLGLGRAMDAGRVTDEFIDWFLGVLRHTDTMVNELRALPKVVTPIRGINQGMVLSDELVGRIEAPVLLVWGGEDPIGGEEVAEPFAKKFADSTLEMLPLAGHAPWIDEPELCAQLASDFLMA